MCLNIDAYGRSKSGDRINIHRVDMVVTSTGMFTFDAEKYEEKPLLG